MIVMFKNSFNRMLQEKAFLIISTFLTIICMTAAILLTTKTVIKANIAVIGNENRIEEVDGLDISYLEEEPPESELVEGRYDAVIKFGDDNSFDIRTVKGEEFEEKLKEAACGNIPERNEEERGVGTNIIGFMIMFLLLQGVVYTKLLAEDRERHITERILVSPIRFAKYLSGYGLFSMTSIIIPTMLVIVVADFVGLNIGFSIAQYAILISILALLGTCFGLCINSFFNSEDTSSMLGNVVVILTSILGGSFASLSDKEAVFDKVIKILPQKDFMSFADALEKGSDAFNYNFQILYVILISIILLVIAVLKISKDYRYRIN